MVVVRDKIIRASDEEPDFSYIPEMGDLSLVEYMLKSARERVEKQGDLNILVNANLALKGVKTEGHEKATLRLSELELPSRHLAKSLKTLGLAKGDYVHILFPNTTNYFYPVFAAWLCNAVMSPANPATNLDNLVHQLRKCPAKVIFCYQADRQKVVEAVKAVGLTGTAKIVVLGAGDECMDGNIFDFDQLISQGEASEEPDPICTLADDDLTMLLWSSGSTGKSKAIMHTFRPIKDFLYRQWGTTRGDLVQTTCFFHGGGFVQSLASFCIFRMSCFFPVDAIPGERDVIRICQAVHKYKPVLLMAGSHHCVRLAGLHTEDTKEMDLSSLQEVFPLGANCPEDLYETLLVHFPKLTGTVNSYAISEFGYISESNTPRHIGKVHPGVLVKITDPATGEALGPHQIGEIRANMDGVGTLMIGYLNNPEADKEVFSEDGFAHTGDLGHYDEEGILYFDARLKDLIKYCGNHIYPIEIEDVIQKHPDVLEVAVYGKPDPAYQELVTALVVRQPGSKATEEEIVDFTNSKVDDHLKLRGGLVFVDSLPRSQPGKILRRMLPDWVK